VRTRYEVLFLFLFDIDIDIDISCPEGLWETATTWPGSGKTVAAARTPRSWSARRVRTDSSPRPGTEASFCTASTSNLSNGFSASWVP